MVPEQESNARASSEETTKTPGVFKRPRRSGRGRRGRGRRPVSTQPETAPQQVPADVPRPEGSGSEPQPEQKATSYETPSYPKEPERLRETPVAPAATHSLEQAIVEVNHIIETLRETLDEMEEVLETLELAERQKDADEREIETLRRSLRNIQRPRDEHRSPRDEHRRTD